MLYKPNIVITSPLRNLVVMIPKNLNLGRCRILMAFQNHLPLPALFTFLGYLILSVFGTGYLPFVQNTMFSFHSIQRATVFPLFWADGEVSHERNFTDFQGFPTESITNLYQGYECGVESHFHQMEYWITNNLATNEPSTSSVPIDIGIYILSKNGGKLSIKEEIRASGFAEQR
jgi:hypothetical protein